MPRCDLVEPPQQCSSEESPCWHNPTQDPLHCEEAPACEDPAPPELPEPQCPQFTDRGGTVRPLNEACDCYFGQVWHPCPEEECGFPQGVPNEAFTGVQNPGVYGSVVNRAMADLSGCAVGTDCPITFHPDVWMALVCEKLCDQGLNCGRHDNEPPGASDQISVKRGSFCDGQPHENYQVYNYGGKKVRWAPGGTQDAWIVDPSTPACASAPSPPPTGQCPQPHPDMSRMKFTSHERGNHLDTTLTTVGQPEFCASIGFCCTPGSPSNDCDDPQCVPRGGCPVRPECGPSDPPDAICHDRALCEAELCDQQWTCNGEPRPGWRGNQAQTDCEGHYKTWCANAPTVVLEGDR
jgi:hypothetical protein